MIITVRDRIVAAGPWLPWIAPGSLGGADALNMINPPSLRLYNLLLALSLAVTIGRLAARSANAAQVREAMLIGYQLHAEHCADSRQALAQSRPVAVGEHVTVALPRRLQAVHPPADVATANGHVYRGQAPARSAAESMPAQATRRAHLASARPPQPQP